MNEKLKKAFEDADVEFFERLLEKCKDVEVPPLERLERSRPFFAIIGAEMEKDQSERDLDKIKACSDVEAAVYAEDLSLKIEIDVTGTPLCPGRPELCLGSDHYPEFDLCCDECDHFLKCFPEYDVNVDQPTLGH